MMAATMPSPEQLAMSLVAEKWADVFMTADHNPVSKIELEEGLQHAVCAFFCLRVCLRIYTRHQARPDLECEVRS